jgi:hypothetical protein
MGTASTTKFIKNSAGSLAEEAALTTSAGAADANKIPALNASGVLDPSIVNAKVSSVGAADAGKVVQLDGSGRLDSSVMPVGIGADTKVMMASEALAAGDYVNIWSDGGSFKVRKADATTNGKRAHGFVLSAVSSGANATVYFEGENTAVTGMTPGDVFLGITAGSGQASAPTGSGQVVQRIGVATSATSVNFEPSQPIVLA